MSNGIMVLYKSRIIIIYYYYTVECPYCIG